MALLESNFENQLSFLGKSPFIFIIMFGEKESHIGPFFFALKQLSPKGWNQYVAP